WHSFATQAATYYQARQQLITGIAGSQAPVTVALSGKITGAEGVTVTLSGGALGTQTVSSGGTYSFTVTAGGNYTVTPSKAGYNFTPADKTFSAVDANQTQDFTGQVIPVVSRIVVSVPEEVQTGIAFPVEVSVQNVTDLFGAGFVLNYPEGVSIAPNSVAAGEFLGSDQIFLPTVDENARQVQVGMTRKSGQPGASGGGILVSVQFTADYTILNGSTLTFTVTGISANTPNDTPIFLSAVPGVGMVNSNRRVWPGDTDNNGLVSQVDILPLGQHWGKTGPQRDVRSNAWTPQISAPWNPVAATYADANGDGVINQNDILSIGLNWGKAAQVAKLSLPLVITDGVSAGSMRPEAEIALPVAAGTEFWVNIEAREVASIFGLSMVLTYDRTDLVEAVTAESGAFLGKDIIFFPLVDTAEGRIAFGISRKSGQTGVDGSGTVLRVKFKTLSNISDGTPITLTLRDIVATDASGGPVTLTATEGVIAGIITGVESAPGSFRMDQNHPNPFNPTTSIEYVLPKEGLVRLEVLNITGQVVRVLTNGHQPQGRHTVVWNALDDKGAKVSAGVYFYHLRMGNNTAIKKMLLLP
ncbi:MAG: cohesin domain-containing protein, partial [Candidatus Latescibacterota bacterium]